MINSPLVILYLPLGVHTINVQAILLDKLDNSSICKLLTWTHTTFLQIMEERGED